MFHFIKLLPLLFLSVAVLPTKAQKFYLGNSLNPTTNEFQLLGTSPKTGVSTYRYKKEISDSFYDRQIGDIIVGIRDGIIVTTIYNLIPKKDDIGIPYDIRKQLDEKFPYPFKEVNGVYGLNIDNETISISRVTNSLTFNMDRIMFMNSLKQSLLEKSKN